MEPASPLALEQINIAELDGAEREGGGLLDAVDDAAPLG
jgi:hypothetical protein